MDKLGAEMEEDRQDDDWFSPSSEAAMTWSCFPRRCLRMLLLEPPADFLRFCKVVDKIFKASEYLPERISPAASALYRIVLLS